MGRGHKDMLRWRRLENSNETGPFCKIHHLFVVKAMDASRQGLQLDEDYTKSPTS